MKSKQIKIISIIVLSVYLLLSISNLTFAEDLENGFSLYLPIIQKDYSSDSANLPPNQPTNPTPYNDQSHVSVITTLSWSASDPNGDNLTFDVYLEAEDPSPNVLVSSNQSTTYFSPEPLSSGLNYYWKIIVKDEHGSATAGPVWHFDTIPNSAPNPPSNPDPADGTSGISTSIILSWICDDPDQEILTYNIYFEENDSTPDSLVSTGQSFSSFDPGLLSYKTDYYWQVIAIDEFGLSTPGPIWNFTTIDPNYPTNPTPYDREILISTNINLSWSTNIPGWDTVTFDLYFEANDSSPDNLVSSNQTSTIFNPGFLNYGTTYYWQIIVRIDGNINIIGPIWSFRINYPPNQPVNLNPLDGSTGTSIYPFLSWAGSDPDGDVLTYDIYFEANDMTPDDLLSGSQTSTFFSLGPLSPNTIYYWQIVSKDIHGVSTPGPIWGFSTKESNLIPQTISGGQGINCALTKASGVKCWGRNGYGSLGDGTQTDRTTPVDVIGLSSGVLKISAGSVHTCALTINQGLKCWGYNLDGQLGDGTLINRLSPVDVFGLSSGIQDISSGYYHSCSISVNGGVKCWGDNSSGQLGDGTTTNRTTPVDVIGLSSGVQKISAGAKYTCALLNDGGVKCWGYNSYGQLGDGTTTNRTTPVDVIGLSSGVQKISAGANHSCALTINQGLKCWGYNINGQLGDGTLINRLSPVDVFGLSSGVLKISAGGFHTCVITAENEVKCWGRNGDGQLGDGTNTSTLIPINSVESIIGARIISAGWNHTCSINEFEEAFCWGDNNFGQLGNGTLIDTNIPVDVIGLSDP